MIGASGSYAVNGTEFSLQPTNGRWVDRDVLGFDGNSHPVYPAPRDFELSWQLISANDLAQVVGFYNSIQATGTVSVDVPKWNGNPYQFQRYSGCTLGEPQVGSFFEGFTQEVKILIYGIPNT